MPTVFLAHTEPMFRRYYGEAALAALRRVARVRRHAGEAPLSGRALAEAAAGAEIVIADRMTPGEAETFAGAPDLVAFLRCAVDIRTVDVAAASAHGILVTRASPAFVDSVAELTVGLIIELARGIGEASAAYRAGAAPQPRLGRQLAGATLGIVGYGLIGRRLAEIALALRMRVLVSDPYAAPDDAAIAALPFRDLLAAADIVVCLAAATEETEGLFDDAAFRAMRPGSLFVNVARGDLVDEAALARALGSGHLAGAALDVGRAPDQMPSPWLARRADVVATPHVGGLTPEAAWAQAFDTVRQVEALASGRLPEGAVNAASAFRLARLAVSPP